MTNAPILSLSTSISPRGTDRGPAEMPFYTFPRRDQTMVLASSDDPLPRSLPSRTNRANAYIRKPGRY